VWEQMQSEVAKVTQEMSDHSPKGNSKIIFFNHWHTQNDHPHLKSLLKSSSQCLSSPIGSR
jgi:hypothetical protein